MVSASKRYAVIGNKPGIRKKEDTSAGLVHLILSRQHPRIAKKVAKILDNNASGSSSMKGAVTVKRYLEGPVGLSESNWSPSAVNDGVPVTSAITDQILKRRLESSLSIGCEPSTFFAMGQMCERYKQGRLARWCILDFFGVHEREDV